MTEDALKRIEGGLAIILPAEYRNFMLARGAGLREFNKACGRRLAEALDLTANDVLITNCTERKPGSGTADAYPKWWQTFVLIGTDGGGGYYCLHLDGTPGVWTIGSDDDGEAEKLHGSLSDFVEDQVKRCQEPPNV
ncbi:: SMI1_KNR4 [Gemmata massiliana]|uniref:: SMI1_KNR4 n=1 Tax=Gemmata massiliana TaxID=1210884 RepID=A0A6P2D5N1_9BACT|nr:SMI1/KNR4 family protein [Gemmata massiliana]VTR95755.1 : SMI1_KNR4 [Gemmata massiliana]